MPARPSHRHLPAGIAGLVAAMLFAAPAAGQGGGPFRTPDPTFSGSYLAGLSAWNENDLTAAMTFFGQALKLEPNDIDLVDRTFRLRLAGGEIAGALTLADQLIVAQADNWVARLMRAIESIRIEDFAAARTELNAMGPSPLTDLTSGLMSAWVEMGSGNADAALARIDEIDGPEWFAVFKNYHAALIADLAGRTQEAVALMAKAHDVDDAALRVAEAFARLKARVGDNKGALALFDDYVEAGRSHPLIDRLRAEIAAGKVPPPVVANARVGSAEVLYGIGALISSDGASDFGAIYLQLAVYLDRGADVARSSLGDLFQQSGRYQEAIDTYRQIDKDSPMYERARVQAGICLELLERSEEAMATLGKIVEEDPANLDAVVALSNIQRSKDLFQESADTLAKGIAALGTPTPAHWRLFYFRGIGYERTKQWPLAEADFKKALELNPDQPQVLNYLGYSWVDMGMNLDEALAMIRKAVDLSENDGYIVDSLGWAYYRLGRFDEAVKELERAVELKPDDPVINDHLGDAYWKVGRRREAVFQWSHALDFEPEDDARPVIVAKLENGLDGKPKASDAAPADADPNATGEAAQEKVAALTPTADVPQTVEVAPGDSLWRLAEKYYGDPELYRSIYDANRDRIDNPDVIVPGMMLNLPRPAARN